jgi:hypothetical protein
MKAIPAFQFYGSDWLRDPGLRSCSLAARGLWIDMLAFMHEAEPYGHLRLNRKDIEPAVLARMVGSALKETEQLLHELEDAGVFSRTEDGTIFSRRMVRDQELRERRAQYGPLSATNPAVPRKKDTEKDTIKDTFTPSLPPSLGGSPSSSSSSSSSSSWEKESECPTSVEAVPTVTPEYLATSWNRIIGVKTITFTGKLHATIRKACLLRIKEHPTMEWWSEYFTRITQAPWLTGRVPGQHGKEPFMATFNWVLGPLNMGKILSGDYDKHDSIASNGHGPALTCTKRVQGPDEKFLRPCGQPVSPQSRQTEPRCSQHLSEATRPKELTHATH